MPRLYENEKEKVSVATEKPLVGAIFYSQHSRALCADESTNSHVDVGRALLPAIEAHLVLWHTGLKVPQELRPTVGLRVGRRGRRNRGM